MKFSPTVKKISKYLLIFLAVCTLIATGICAYLLNANYEFSLPKFTTRIIEYSVTNQISADSTNISPITFKKKDSKSITVSFDSLISLKKKNPILEINKVEFSYEIPPLFSKAKKTIHIDRVLANLDKIKKTSSSSNHAINDLASLNKLLKKRLKLSYASLYSFSIKNIGITRDKDIQNFQLNYHTKLGYHVLELSHLDQGSAKISITANTDNVITKINTKITRFPLWFIIKFVSKDHYSDFTRHLDDNFLIDSDIQYAFKKNKEPQLKAKITKTAHQHKNVKSLILELSNKNDLNLYLNKFLFEDMHGGIIKAKGDLIFDGSFIADKLKINADVHIENFGMKYIGDFWPKSLQGETRSWIVKSFKNGTINKASCKINIKNINRITNDDFSAFIDFHNLELDYLDQHKSLTGLYGTANFTLDSVKISVEKGKVLSSKILPSYVQIDYGKNEVPITIKTKAKGQAADFIHFIDKKTYDNLIKRGIDLNHTNGRIKANIFLSFPIAEDFEFDKTNLHVEAKLSEFRTNLYNKISFTNGELDLELTNKLLSLSGPLDINDQNSNFEWITHFGEPKKGFSTKMTLHSFIKDNSNFEDILNNKLRILDGHALLNVVYYDKNSHENLQINLDLDDANFYIPPLGIQKEQKVVSTFTLDLHKEPKQNWKSRKLIFDSEDGININGDLEASEDFGELTSANFQFIYPKTNFAINLKQNESEKIVKITGHEINLANAHISEIFSNNQFYDNPAHKSKASKALNLSIFLDNAYVNNNTKFTNIVGNFKCLNLECSQSDLNVDINNTSKLKIWMEKSKKKSAIWKLHTNNASELLKGLGMYHDFIGGELSINAWMPKSGKSLQNTGNVFIGDIKMKDFEAIKNPIVTKLVSFTSVMGILNIFTNMNKIPFKQLDGYFVFADDVLRLNRVNAYGSYLTMTMNGTIDWNYNDIDIYGKVVPPVYGFNYILSFIPFIGHDTAGGKGKGLIAANYSITGKLNDTRVSINPLSIIFSDIFEFMLI
ncbi:MAG: DUF3971 domain-containing protein [Rickettsiales bacterium]